MADRWPATSGVLHGGTELSIEIHRSVHAPTDRWQTLAIEPLGATRLGISVRPRQAEAFGLDPQATMRALVAYRFPLIRLGAYWNRIEPKPAVFDPSELDWQVDLAEKAGKQIILCVGAVKTFGYPEVFVPQHYLDPPLAEGRLIGPATHARLLEGATQFVSRVVERYRNRSAVVAWQVEHEAVDPLGLEHSWRLEVAFLEKEVEAVRRADPERPIMLNGYLPTSLLESLPQRWRTRGQGDSLAAAQQHADVVGVDYYPRHALLAFGQWTIYLNSTASIWRRGAGRRLGIWARQRERRLMIAEGQAEPWEGLTVPPNPAGGVTYSCPPDQIIENYNRMMRSASAANLSIEAYLFWGAEYWMLRKQSGDPTYLRAFERILSADA